MRRAALAVAVVALAMGVGASSASAAGLPEGYVPWPDLLPGRTVGCAAPPHSVPGCRSLRIACVDRLIVRLRREWRAEDATCDHRSIFSLGYLNITSEIRRRLASHETFRYRPWFISVVQGFSNEYFAYQRRFDAGKGVPGPGGSTTRRWTAATSARARTSCSPRTPTPITISPTPMRPPGS